MFGCMFLSRRPISVITSSAPSDPALKYKYKTNHNTTAYPVRKFPPSQSHLPQVENVSIAVYPTALSNHKWKMVSIGLASLLIAQFLYSVFGSAHAGSVAAGECLVNFGTYLGQQYRVDETLGRKCLFESPWMKIQQHLIQADGTPSSLSWLWIDVPDRVHVLVEAPNENGSAKRHFYVLERSPYALEGRRSWSVVSGTQQKGERPEIAAARQIEAELQLQCNDLKILGRFRTDESRGLGWSTSYVASNCKPSEGLPKLRPGERRLGANPSVRSDLKVVSLEELKESTMNGAFVEVQWSHTVSMALLHPEMSSTN